MLVLEAKNIKKYYGDRLIVGFKELKIFTGDRIGIIGQNGSGKTTLMNILADELQPDEGKVIHYCDFSYVRQFSEEGFDSDQWVLSEFGLSDKTAQEAFSGGERTRIKIANALSNDRPLLFADEPTSNLDYKGISLLMQKLSELDTFVVISHDRTLLDSLCTRIIEVRGGELRFYNGNYSLYKEQSELEFDYAVSEYEKYVAEKTSLEAAIVDRRSRVKSMKKTPTRMGNSEARLHKRETTERQQKVNQAVSSLSTRLEKLEPKERPKSVPEIKLDFSLTSPPENKIVISADKLSFGYGNNMILSNAGFKVYNGTKTVLWGENGAGKSTLLNLINGRETDEIRIVPRARLGYFYQGFENLDFDKTVLENVMAESVQSQTTVRTILARLLIARDDVYKKVGCLSGGERIKVAFAKLFVSAANILLLDEPTNYLDMLSIEALEKVIQSYEGTILFASHDSAFVEAVANRMLIVENQAVTEFDGGLKQYGEYLLKNKK